MCSVKCLICNDIGGKYDKQKNQFTPCKCLIVKRNNYRFEQIGLPVKYWDSNIDQDFQSQVDVIEKFLNSRQTLKKDHLIVNSNSNIRCQEFVCLSIKRLIETNRIKNCKIVQFSKLILEITQSWKKNDDTTENISRFKYTPVFVLLDLNLSLLKENMSQLVLQELLQHRENNRLTTIISTNIDKETICNYFDLDFRYFCQYKLK